MDEFAVFLLIIMLLFLIVLPAGIISINKYWHCPRYSVALEKETKYQIGQGCFLKLENGNWIPLEKYQGINIENP